MPPRIVLDSGLRSSRGASFQILRLVGTGAFRHALSVPLVLEYESVLLRHRAALGLSDSQVLGFVDYLCASGDLHDIHFLWRPLLNDPGDEMIADLAVKSGTDYVVTHNVRDFRALGATFGIPAIRPGAFLRRLASATPPSPPDA